MFAILSKAFGMDTFLSDLFRVQISYSAPKCHFTHVIQINLAGKSK